MDLNGLPTELEQYVQQKIAEGKFASVEEVVSAALLSFQEREAKEKNGQTVSNGYPTQTPDDIIRAIKQAFETDAPLLAERLAREGAERYPEHAELQKYARVLAPPLISRAISTSSETREARKANQAWMKSNWQNYRGHWIALRAGQLLHAAPSMDDLIAEVGEVRGQGILLTKIA